MLLSATQPPLKDLYAVSPSGRIVIVVDHTRGDKKQNAVLNPLDTDIGNLMRRETDECFTLVETSRIYGHIK